MSWFLLNRNLTLLEPYDWKLSRTVLRGERGSNASDLPGKAIASANMAGYIKYLYKTVRKFFGEAVVVTQEVDDIIQSPIVKETYHQQLRLQNTARSAQVHEQVRPDSGTLGTDGQGARTNPLHQPEQRCHTVVQGGVDRTGRRAVRRLCHRSVESRIPHLYDGGDREDAGACPCRAAWRQHGTCRQAARRRRVINESLTA